MTTAIALLTRDLRVHDNPVLVRAIDAADRVLPLFVLDDDLLRSSYSAPNRVHWMIESLDDLRSNLRDRGGDLIVRRGSPIDEIASLIDDHRVASVHVAADASAFGAARIASLQDLCEQLDVDLVVEQGAHNVLPPGEVTPGSGDHYKVYTPYMRAWSDAGWRKPLEAPAKVPLLSGVTVGGIPQASDLIDGEPSPHRMTGGETVAREQFDRWVGDELSTYDDRRDDMAGDHTSRFAAALHFGNLSALECAHRIRGRAGSEPFIRQLAWRDFHHQVLAVNPDLPHRDYRSRGDRWSRSERNFTAWVEGQTGFPIVDAGMRQLKAEGFMHNRARMIVASFLTKDLYLDWRWGAAHFLHWLSDGDLANNSGNWQWIAGTGNDTRPNRVFNPIRQAERFDKQGAYVRKWVPELASLPGKTIHTPWELGPIERATLDYPDPIVDHDEAAAAFLANRGVET